MTPTPYEELPTEVKDILNKYDKQDNTYKELSRLCDELKEVGWFGDYGLDAELCELRPLKRVTHYWNNGKPFTTTEEY